MRRPRSWVEPVCPRSKMWVGSSEAVTEGGERLRQQEEPTRQEGRCPQGQLWGSHDLGAEARGAGAGAEGGAARTGPRGVVAAALASGDGPVLGSREYPALKT